MARFYCLNRRCHVVKYSVTLIWVCLKIVYPYTQWFCWSLSLLDGYFIGGIPHFQTNPNNRGTFVYVIIPIGSMVLLCMVCHGSHQYTPVMLAYIPYMDPMGYIVNLVLQRSQLLNVIHGKKGEKQQPLRWLNGSFTIIWCLSHREFTIGGMTRGDFGTAEKGTHLLTAGFKREG